VFAALALFMSMWSFMITKSLTLVVDALIGEMRRVSGSVVVGGSVSYCPQRAWIQNATVRDNILFGSPFDQERYERVIHACALEHDLALLPCRCCMPRLVVVVVVVMGMVVWEQMAT
jgi:hypothetical protein